MNIKHAILVISIYGCGFAKLESKGYTGYKSKEISSSSHDDPMDESLASADDLQSTEVGNGRKLDRPNSGDLGRNSDAIAKKTPESTEIGNGQKPDIIPGTINIDSEQANAEIESSIVTGAFLNLCVLSSKRVNCRLNSENKGKYDFENLKVYDLTHNEIPSEEVSYKVLDENLEISINDEVEIGSIEIDQQDIDLSMNVTDEVINQKLTGVYHSPTWGNLEIRFNSEQVLIVYQLNKYFGYALASFNHDTGVIKGTWCERLVKKNGKLARIADYSGLLEFHFEYGEDGLPQAMGRWNNGEDTEWHNDWNLAKLSEQSTYEEHFKNFDDYKCN